MSETDTPEAVAPARGPWDVRRVVVVLASVFVLALAVRTANVFVWRPSEATCPPEIRAGAVVGDGGCYAVAGDAQYSLLQGELAARGHWFASSAVYVVTGAIDDGAGDPPLYAVFLAEVSALAGTGGDGARVVGVGVLLAVCGVAWAIGRRRSASAGRVALASSAVVASLLVAASTIPGERIELATVPGAGPRHDAFLLADGVAHRAASGVVGAVGAALLALVAWRVAGQRAALVAGVIGAIHPLLWINDGMILSESLYVPLIALVLLAALSWQAQPTPVRSALLGAAVALAALTRAEALLLFPFAVAPLVLARRDAPWRERLRHLCLAGAVGAALVAPWIGWNLVRFDAPATMTSGTGAVLSAGTCDVAFGLTEGAQWIGYYGADCYGDYIRKGLPVGDPRLPGCDEAAAASLRNADPRDDRRSDACWPAIEGFDEASRDAISRDLAFEYLGSHTRRLPVVIAARIGRMWDVVNAGQGVRLNWLVEGRGKRASEYGLWAYWAMLAAAPYGLVLLRRRGISLSPYFGIAAAVTVTAALSFGVTRYRVPADAALVVLAGVVVDHLLDARSREDADSDDADSH